MLSARVCAQAALLSITELAFAFLLDVTVLQEPTTPLATAGAATVLVGSMLVAFPKKSQPMSDAPPLIVDSMTANTEWESSSVACDEAIKVENPSNAIPREVSSIADKLQVDQS